MNKAQELRKVADDAFYCLSNFGISLEVNDGYDEKEINDFVELHYNYLIEKAQFAASEGQGVIFKEFPEIAYYNTSLDTQDALKLYKLRNKLIDDGFDVWLCNKSTRDIMRSHVDLEHKVIYIKW